MVKVTKADLYAMLSAEEKAKYCILFSREDYNPLLNSIENLKKSVALASHKYARNHQLLESHQREDNNHGQFENLMNQLATLDREEEDPYAACEVDEISDCLESESEMEDVDME